MHLAQNPVHIHTNRVNCNYINRQFTMYDWQFTSLIMHRNAFVIHGTVNWFPRLSPDLRSESCFYCSHCILNPKQSILHVVQIVSNCFHVQMQAKCSKRNGIIDELCCGFNNNNNDGLCSIMRSSNFFCTQEEKRWRLISSPHTNIHIHTQKHIKIVSGQMHQFSLAKRYVIMQQQMRQEQ